MAHDAIMTTSVWRLKNESCWGKVQQNVHETMHTLKRWHLKITSVEVNKERSFLWCRLRCLWRKCWVILHVICAAPLNEMFLGIKAFSPSLFGTALAQGWWGRSQYAPTSAWNIFRQKRKKKEKNLTKFRAFLLWLTKLGTLAISAVEMEYIRTCRS